MATGHYTLRPRPRWTSGALTCVAFFVLGGFLLWGLFRAPRTHAPPSPKVRWGVPDRPIRVVCLDAGAWTRNVPGAAALIDSLDPDFVLAQRVPGDAVLPLAEALGMQRTFHPGNFVRVGGDAAPGCLILSKHPLYDAAPLHGEAGRDAPLGVWATAVVDDCRFSVATADAGANLSGRGVPALAAATALDLRRQARGNPPLLAAFRAPGMLSTRSELLRTAGLADLTAAAPRASDPPGVAPLIGAAGPWRVLAERSSQPRPLAPGIFWVEVTRESADRLVGPRS